MRTTDALTVLDGVVQHAREPIAAPPDYDETQVTSLNQQWELLTLKSAEGSGWVRWLHKQVWAVVAPLFARQQAFNSALVDHVNRNVSTHRETVRVLAEALRESREDHLRLVTFQSKLILYAQQVTLYIDTKDREGAGLMRGDVARVMRLLSDDVQKRWESTQCSLGVLNRATHTLKHVLERIDHPASDRRQPEGEPSDADAADPETGAHIRAAAARAQLNSYKYVAFEDRFRGPQEEIRERLKVYAPIFRGANDVVDLGCGRGEFLDVLREAGVSARGVDGNHEMADVCRDRGLQATAGDALHTCRHRRMNPSEDSLPLKWSSTWSRITCCSSSNSATESSGLVPGSSSRRSTQPVGMRSFRAIFVTSPTRTHCTPRRCSTSW